MNEERHHRIKEITPLENMKIKAEFYGENERIYDVKTLYSTFPQFKILENNPDLFNKVIIDAGGYGISWNDELDLDAEDVWEFGEDINS